MDRIHYMKNALHSLERCPNELRDQTMNELIAHLKEIIHRECDHDWIEDWIDLPCGNMRKIYYCLVCETTQSA